MQNERLTTLRAELFRILPMYAAACVVILCGIGAYLSTYDDFGGAAVTAVLAGVGASVLARLFRMRQDTMFGVLAALVVALISWVSITGGASAGAMLGVLGDRNNFPSVLLAWFVILYSFAMVTDEVIIFAIVPSIALLGTVASDNLNADILVYFAGLLLSAVFLLVYENMLSRGAVEPSPVKAARASEPAGVRTSLLMTAVVVAMAMLAGFAVSRPLTMAGDALRGRTPDVPLSGASRFASEMTARYINNVMDLSGAPPHLSDRVMMRVKSPRPEYWRGQVFTDYTGYSWTASERPGREHQVSPGLIDVKPDGPDALYEFDARVPMIQQFELPDGPASGVRIAAADPVRFRYRWRGSRHGDDGAVDEHSGLRAAASYTGRGTRAYAVLSSVSVATPEQLRAAGTDYPVALKFANTQLGGDPNPVRREIAEQVTAGATTEYDKVKALETWLRANFDYTLNPPRTPSSVDAVTYFLTRTKQGYCEIFASSMAVLCREIGIPARLATGFAPGEWDPHGGGNAADYAIGMDLPDKIVQAASRSGAYGVSTVRERDLHAWTEVYFPGYGWIAFDPTSSREAAPTWGRTIGERFKNLMRQVLARANGTGLILLGIAAIALFLVKTYGLDTLRASTWWKAGFLNRRRLSPTARWDALYARAIRRLRRRAGPKSPGQTPYEYADHARAVLAPPAATALDALTEVYVRRAFQREEPTEQDVEKLLALDADLKKALRRSEPEPAFAHGS